MESDNCTECSDLVGRVADSVCACKEIGYFEENIPICGVCDTQCKKCVDQADKCTECADLTTRNDTE